MNDQLIDPTAHIYYELGSVCWVRSERLCFAMLHQGLCARKHC